MKLIKNCMYRFGLIFAFAALTQVLCHRLDEIEDGVSCNSLIDVVLVLDESGSVGKTNWETVLVPFAHDIFKVLDIGLDKVRTSVIMYATSTKEKWGLNHASNESFEKLKIKIEELKKSYEGGHTYTATALKTAQEMVYGKESRPEAHKLVILVTDGESDEPAVPAANSIREKGATFMVVGVKGGDSYSEKECLALAGCEKVTGCDMYQVATWATAQSMSEKIMKIICKKIATNAECKKDTSWSNCTEPCGPGVETETITYTEIKAPTADDDGVLGKNCDELHPPPDKKNTRPCNLKVCTVHAECGEFGEWGLCSATCGVGIELRKRAPYVLKKEKENGKSCKQQNLFETEERACNLIPCEPVGGGQNIAVIAGGLIGGLLLLGGAGAAVYHFRRA